MVINAMYIAQMSIITLLDAVWCSGKVWNLSPVDLTELLSSDFVSSWQFLVSMTLTLYSWLCWVVFLACKGLVISMTARTTSKCSVKSFFLWTCNISEWYSLESQLQPVKQSYFTVTWWFWSILVSPPDIHI